MNNNNLLETIKEFNLYDVDQFNQKFKDSFLYKTLSITMSDENHMARAEGKSIQNFLNEKNLNKTHL
jgi:hypothetical protein